MSSFVVGFHKCARVLTTKARNKLPASDFVYPRDRKFPVQDKAHARNALARAHFAPDPERVRRAVYQRYPDLKPENKE